MPIYGVKSSKITQKFSYSKSELAISYKLNYVVINQNKVVEINAYKLLRKSPYKDKNY